MVDLKKVMQDANTKVQELRQNTPEAKVANWMKEQADKMQSSTVQYKDSKNKVKDFGTNTVKNAGSLILNTGAMFVDPQGFVDDLSQAGKSAVDYGKRKIEQYKQNPEDIKKDIAKIPDKAGNYIYTHGADVALIGSGIAGGAKGVTNVMNKGNIVKGGVKAPTTQVQNASGLNIKTNPNAVKVYNYEAKKLPYTEITPEQAVSELNPKPQYTVNDYINPKTGKTDWTMADDVISQATEPKNMLTQEVKHGTAVPFEGNVSSSKVGTGTDSGWLEHGGYHTIGDFDAEVYASGIPVSSRLKNIGDLPPEVRGRIADELYLYNRDVKIPDDRFKNLQSIIDNKINEYDSLLKTKGYTPEEYNKYKLYHDSWKSVKDNLKQEADVSNLRPRIITSEVPADQYLMFRDKPIIEQSQDIKNLAIRLYTDQGYSQEQILAKLNRNGGSLYDDLAKHLGSKSKASQVLDALAAKGATDMKGAETVIFNDRNVNSFKSKPIEPNWNVEVAPSNFSADLDNIIDNHFKGLLDGGM